LRPSLLVLGCEQRGRRRSRTDTAGNYTQCSLPNHSSCTYTTGLHIGRHQQHTQCARDIYLTIVVNSTKPTHGSDAPELANLIDLLAFRKAPTPVTDALSCYTSHLCVSGFCTEFYSGYSNCARLVVHSYTVCVVTMILWPCHKHGLFRDHLIIWTSTSR
jgi:hypothetical protein